MGVYISMVYGLRFDYKTIFFTHFQGIYRQNHGPGTGRVMALLTMSKFLPAMTRHGPQ